MKIDIAAKLSAIASKLNLDRVSYAPTWDFRNLDAPVLVGRLTNAKVTVFEDEKTSEPSNTLTLEFCDHTGVDVSIHCPSKLRSCFLRLADVSYDDFIVVGSEHTEKLGALVGRAFVVANTGLGEAKKGQTAPYLFDVWEVGASDDLAAHHAMFVEAFTSPASGSGPAGDL